MRQGELFKVFSELKIKRARVLERGEVHEVEIQVPAKKVDDAYLQVGAFWPMAIALKVTKLAWWRCWFTNYQIIKES